VQFFLANGRELDGWTLNQSPGGIRAVLEEPVELGAKFEVSVGGRDRRPGRIVWIQDEPDGAIVGVAFLDTTEEPPSEPVQERESEAPNLEPEPADEPIVEPEPTRN
jgi:hypothetical protein